MDTHLKPTRAILFLILTIAFKSYAQNPTGSAVSDKYHRSSIYTMMIPGGSKEENADVIQAAYSKSPVPDKFNDHNLESRVTSLGLNDEKAVSAYLDKNDVAKMMVAKWFKRSAKGGFDMGLISQRGNYDATQMDVGIAKSSQRGLALLSDAGEELIGNTFVLVTYFKYVNIAEKEKEAKKVAGVASSVLGRFAGAGSVGVSAATKAGEGAADKLKGFGVQATSYLYRLDWNDSVAAVFYNEYWTTDDKIDAAKKAAFDNSHIFKLKYIGTDEAKEPLITSTYNKKTDKELIGLATVRAVNKVIVVLQRKHEEFRTKTPIFSVDPIVAKIGMKEGLEEGDKYDVLEQQQGADGKTVYKKIADIRVDDKKYIWDNRYEETQAASDSSGGTRFRGGGKNIYPGLLLKQK